MYIIIGLIILLVVIIYYNKYYHKEHFIDTPESTNPSTNTANNTTTTTVAPTNSANNATTTTVAPTNSANNATTTTVAPTNSVNNATTTTVNPDLISSPMLNMGNTTVDLSFTSAIPDESDAEINNSIEAPTIVLETIGSSKLILHWQNNTPDGLTIIKYIPKVYECKGIHDECDIGSGKEITDYKLPNNQCTSCYMVINGLDMSQNTYHVSLQILYQNENSGRYYKSPVETKITTREVEQDLNQIYKKALENLLEESQTQKQLDMEQHLQGVKINELRENIATIKTKLFESEKYNGKMKDIFKTPYPIKSYYNKIKYHDPNVKPQQTININDKEYYLGLVV